MIPYEIIQTLNDLEMSIYSYVMKNRHAVIEMKIRELADELHVSTASILRFCRKVGYSGYSELKVHLKLSEKEDLKVPEADESDILTDYFERINWEVLRSLAKIAADQLTKSQSVICMGIGSSGIVARYAARYFASVGVLAISIEEPSYPVAKQNELDTTVILFSVSGESSSILEAVALFKARNYHIISVTNNASSTLARLSDLNISYYVPPHYALHRTNLTTQIPAFHVIEMIGKDIYKNLNM